MVRTLHVQELGRVGYEDALRLQHELVRQRAGGLISDRLLLLEHDPVVTVGRSSKPVKLDNVPFPIIEAERGGEATWHGPGQLVGYPVLLLEPWERDLHRYLRNLEEVIISTVRDLGFEGYRNPPHTGVWVDGLKVASIGVAVKRWVTYHGFALNVSPDLSSFGSFEPCGLAPEVMTSLEQLAGEAVDTELMDSRLLVHFEEVFKRRTEQLSSDGRARIPRPGPRPQTCRTRIQSLGDWVF